MNRLKIMMILFLAMGLLVASTLIPGNLCSDRAVAAEEKGITVRVLLFSGRPDPTYVLDDTQLIEKLKVDIAGAKRLDDYGKQTVIPANIGYKGILVSNPEKWAGLPARFAVYNGAIELMDDQKRFLEDSGGAVEKLLLDEAIRKGVIDDVILKRMRR
jgi:hypothetical protein